MHFAPQDREEDGERSNKIPKNHCERIAGLGGVSGSPGLKKTIRCHLHNHRLFGRVARRKPFLTLRHRSKRLEFAKRHLNYDWKRVLWSDETKI